MKKGRNITLVLVAMLGFLFSCQNEGVNPNKGNNPADLQGSLTDNHEMSDGTCGDAKTYALVSSDGSVFVNRCWGPLAQGNPVINCPVNVPKWGTVTMENGSANCKAHFTLAPGWFIQNATYLSADNSAFAYDPNMVPLTGTDWETKALNPVQNEWHWEWPMQGLGNRFGIAAKLTAVKINLMGNMIPGSATTLWLKDLSQTTAGVSPFVIDWARNWCPEQWPAPQARCVAVNVGVPALNGCTTLAPTLADPVGTVNYRWSTNETSATINVCPTATTTYTAWVSDDSGPRAVYEYTVNLRNVACLQGNGNGNGNNAHKVNVCHIPPGNPNNPQTICIDWSAVPAHVASYRPAGSTQGHDSGCELGSCGSSPCPL